jgi:hypothetical protein
MAIPYTLVCWLGYRLTSWPTCKLAAQLDGFLSRDVCWLAALFVCWGGGASFLAISKVSGDWPDCLLACLLYGLVLAWFIAHHTCLLKSILMLASVAS